MRTVEFKKGKVTVLVHLDDTKTWLGSTKCDICGREIPAEGNAPLSDCLDHYTRKWGVFCTHCIAMGRVKVDYGVGRGQLYLGEGGKYTKVVGATRRTAF